MSESQVTKRYCVRAGEVAGYHPANHTGTLNRRLIGPETVGATQLEVVLGVVEKGRGADPHAHPGIEQVCYMLEGRARVLPGAVHQAPSASGIKVLGRHQASACRCGRSRCVGCVLNVRQSDA